MDILKSKYVKIRKPHKCAQCLRMFNIGAKMYYMAVTDGGDFYSFYLCKTCSDIMAKSHPDDDWYEGDIDSMLDKDETPEQHLKTLCNGRK